MKLFKNPGLKLMAVTVAFLLWGFSHTTISSERGFDLPVALEGVPEDLVVTEQTSDTVNVRVRGSRASLRSMLDGDLVYLVNLTGAKLGVTAHEVETQDLQLPRGLQIVSRSPAGIEFTLASRGRRAVPLKADISGLPSEGFKIERVAITPPRVWISGARSEVLRLSEILTETIEVGGLESSIEKKVRPSLVGRHLWLENDAEVTVRVEIAPEPAKGEEAG